MDQSEIPIIERYNKMDLTYVDFISVEQPCRVYDLISDGADLFFIGQQSFTESIESSFQLEQSFLKSTPIFNTPIYNGTNISISNPNIILPAEMAYFDSVEWFYVYTLPYALFEYDVTNLSSDCLLYTSPSPRDRTRYRMPSSA